MGNQVIKQPDGLFAIFSTITDTIIVYDALPDEIVEYFADRAAEDARRQARRAVEAVDAGRARDVYYQFAMSWDDAVREDRWHQGEAWRDAMADTRDP